MDIRFNIAALPKVFQAYARKAIGDVATTEEQEFRKSQCETCVLFNGQSCSKNRVATKDGKYYEFSDVENPLFAKIKDSFEVVRAVRAPNGDIYYRGCGCPQTGPHAKWKFSFTDEELSKKDGTAPCPLNRWKKNGSAS